jgi:cytidylate kinase
MAAAQGKSSLELNQAAERDRSIDSAIDGFLVSLNDRQERLVVESRMAWHFVHASLKVYLFCNTEKAAERIRAEQRPDESYADASEAVHQITLRRASEVRRFREFYGVDIDDLRNYDLVIDTTLVAPSAVVATIRQGLVLEARPLAWLSPRILLPTSPDGPAWPGGMSGGGYSQSGPSGSDAGAMHPVPVLFVGRRFYICAGHDRVAAALSTGAHLLPARILGVDDEPFAGGLTARQWLAGAVHAGQVADWQAANGFRYDFDPALPAATTLA